MQYSLDKKIRKKIYTYKKKHKRKHKKKIKTYNKKYKIYKTKLFHKHKKNSFKKSLKKNKKNKKNIKGGFISKQGDSMIPFLTELGQQISTTSSNTMSNIQGKPPIPTSDPVDQPLFKVDTAQIPTPGSVNNYYANSVDNVN